jgi:flagellar biosynthesis/type III secretory pathway protein FliH
MTDAPEVELEILRRQYAGLDEHYKLALRQIGTLQAALAGVRKATDETYARAYQQGLEDGKNQRG